MNHVFHLEQPRSEDQVRAMEFAGNRPALPPLMTEMVTTMIYMVEEDEPQT